MADPLLLAMRMHVGSAKARPYTRWLHTARLSQVAKAATVWQPVIAVKLGRAQFCRQ